VSRGHRAFRKPNNIWGLGEHKDFQFNRFPVRHRSMDGKIPHTTLRKGEEVEEKENESDDPRRS
jgi:hypothetical protein